MENSGGRKMTAEKMTEILKKNGMQISMEQAIICLEFLRKLAKISVGQYLRESETEKTNQPPTGN